MKLSMGKPCPKKLTDRHGKTVTVGCDHCVYRCEHCNDYSIYVGYVHCLADEPGRKRDSVW